MFSILEKILKPYMKKVLPLITLLAFALAFVRCSETISESSVAPKSLEIEPYSIQKVEVKPEFPGGNMAMISWLAKQIEFPEKARESDLHGGKVVVSFIVDVDGQVKQVKIEKSIGELFDHQAIEIVSQMPLWTPGMAEGKKVPVKMMLPIRYELR